MELYNYKSVDGPKQRRHWYSYFPNIGGGVVPLWLEQPIFSKGKYELTRKRLLTLLNLLAFVVHGSFLGYTLARVMQLPNWKTYGGVRLPMYKTELNWTYVGNESGSIAFELVPTLVRQSDSYSINLTLLTMAFFGLSALFHFLIIIESINGTLYYSWIDNCRQPLRWVEYSISASVYPSLPPPYPTLTLPLSKL